jgi:ABC-type nitrate/sulfonate/bicarbonate transport system permease component
VSASQSHELCEKLPEPCALRPKAGHSASTRQLSTWQRFGEPLGVVLIVSAIWELLTRSGILPSRDLPPTTAIAAAFVGDVQQSDVWYAVGATMGSWAIGFAAAIIVGVLVGLMLGRSLIGYLIAQPTLEFIRTIPSIAALPLLILLYGTGLELAMIMVFLGAVWPVIIQTMYGVRDVDPTAKDAGRAYGLNRGQLFIRIVLPSALPYIATGIRLGAVLGLILSVAASLLGGGQGIGYLIEIASYSSTPELVFARIALVGLMGLCITLVLTILESKVLFWHESQRKVFT